MLSRLTALRKELHKYPELSGAEKQTAQRVCSFLKEHSCPTKIIKNIGGHGLAVVYEFSNQGPTIAIRCELDALPIEEENDFKHQSKKNGVSHKCGHDGHMTIVAGLGLWLKDQHFSSGKIVLLFQPAEETGQGAQQVIDDDRFKALNIDRIFSLHNIPGESMHQIISMEKGFSAEVQSFSIHLSGIESHASEPENGVNPATTIAEIISSLNILNNPIVTDDNYAVLTPVFTTMGKKAYGVSPANGEIHYTIRTWNTSEMDALTEKIKNDVKSICKKNALKFELNWFEYFPASDNQSSCNAIVQEAAKQNNLTITHRPYPFKFGEDFGWFTKNYETAMFGLGAGIDTPSLHNSTYDFPDELIETGILMFKEIISISLEN